MTRYLFAAIAGVLLTAAVTSWAGPAPAVVMTVNSVSANAGDNSITLDVTLTNNGAGAITIAGFSFGLGVSSSDLTFTGVNTGTTTAPYIFPGTAGSFGPDISVQPPNLPGQSVNARDKFSTSNSGESVGPGVTVGLGHVIFNMVAGAPSEDISVMLSAGNSSLSDQNGNPVPFTIANGTVHVSGCSVATTGPWITASPYPIAISRYGFAQTPTYLYVFGGVTDGSASVNNVNRLDLTTGMWQSRAAMPFTSQPPTCALMADTGIVYCAQGDTGSGFASYNIATDTWTPLASIPGGDHYGSASGAFKGKVFVAGGTLSTTNMVQVYDVATNTWSTGTAAPSAFQLAGYHQVGQYLYVVGGFTTDLNANKTTTYRLDMSSAPGVWDIGPAFTQARADFALAYDGGTNTLYAIGGDMNGGGFFDATNEVDELPLASWPGGTWMVSPPSLNPPNRQANQAGFYGAGKIWSVGGIAATEASPFLADVQTRVNGCPQALIATVNDTVTGPGPNQFDYSSGGWSFFNRPAISSAFQQDEHYAYTTNVIAHFRFHGTSVKIYTVKEPHGGRIGYKLDDLDEVQASNYSPTIMGNQLSYTSPMLNDIDHDLVIRVVGMHDPPSDANAITLDKAEVYGPAAAQVLSATVNDTIIGSGLNMWDYGQSGWSYWNGANVSSAFQGDEHYAVATNTTAHFRFSGTQVKIYTVMEPHGGNIGYKLDNMDELPISNYSPTVMGNVLSYTSPMLADGIHDLAIRVIGTHANGSDANAITVDKAEVYTPPPQVLSATINDTVIGTGDNQWNYGAPGNWSFYNGANVSSAYQGDEHYAYTTNVTATFQFTGTQIKIYTVKEPAGGNIGYTLDATPEQIISNYAPSVIGNSLSYESPVVTSGAHTLTIRVVGTHQSGANGNAITVDKAEVYTAP